MITNSELLTLPIGKYEGQLDDVFNNQPYGRNVFASQLSSQMAILRMYIENGQLHPTIRCMIGYHTDQIKEVYVTRSFFGSRTTHIRWASYTSLYLIIVQPGLEFEQDIFPIIDTGVEIPIEYFI